MATAGSADAVMRVSAIERLAPFSFDDGESVTRVAAFTGGVLELQADASHFIIVLAGVLHATIGGRTFDLDAECYAALSGGVRIGGEASALVISSVGYGCATLLGGPVEERGRLRYVDGCTASMLLSPQLRGEPCLNFMHLPERIAQTMHTHPSLRCGLILSGTGRCQTETAVLPFDPGTVFFIPPETPHSFQSDAETLRIVIYHPDSDSGPTHEDHTMLNRTFVTGRSAAALHQIHTTTGTLS